MKNNRIKAFFATSLLLFSVTACANIGGSKVSVVDTYIDSNGDLIIVYSDNSTKNGGHVRDTRTHKVEFYVMEEGSQMDSLVLADKLFEYSGVEHLSTIKRPTEEQLNIPDYWDFEGGYYFQLWDDEISYVVRGWSFSFDVVTADMKLCLFGTRKP